MQKILADAGLGFTPICTFWSAKQISRKSVFSWFYWDCKKVTLKQNASKYIIGCNEKKQQIVMKSSALLH